MPDLQIASPIEYLVIGHVTRDRLATGSRLGGTAAYAGLTAAAFGLRTGAVTACSPEEDLSALATLRVFRLPSEHTTTFENRYSGNGRTQFVHALADRITAAAIPLEWRRARILHLGPIAQEVDSDLADHFPDAFRGVTPQGWMRGWDGGGRVSLDLSPEAEKAARKASAVVFAVEDVGGDERMIAHLVDLCPITVVTEGPAGCRVYWNGHIRHFTAPPEPEVDPTGAGDIFAAAFFIRLAETRDPWEAARLANQVAAHSVNRPGLEGIPSPAEVAASKMVVEPR